MLKRQEEDVEVELYAYLTYKGRRISLTFSYLVPREEKKPIDEENPVTAVHLVVGINLVIATTFPIIMTVMKG